MKKDNFTWTLEAKQAFEKLKSLLVQDPILTLPDFNKQFVLGVDAYGYGIGAVLMQELHPIAFISRGPQFTATSIVYI